MPYNNLTDFAITGSTQVFALIGNPVAHSLSPAFWNAAFRHSRIDAVYIPLQVEESAATTAMHGLEALHVIGANITRPLKRKAAEFCKLLHEPARETGVVNTIKFGKFGGEGWNTDITGLQRILKRLPHCKKALVIGDGASAHTALWALNSINTCEVFQIARRFSEVVTLSPLPEHTIDKQHKYLTNLHITRLVWNNKNFAYAIKESDIIIHTTPLGWSREDNVPELDEYLEKDKFYIDFNYAPDSRLVAAARQRGCTVIDGRELLLEQGLESFKLLTGSEPPEEVMRRCIYNDKLSIISGKEIRKELQK